MKYEKDISILYEDYPKYSANISQFAISKMIDYNNEIEEIRVLGFHTESQTINNGTFCTILSLTEDHKIYTRIITICFEEKGVKIKKERIIEDAK